MYVKSLNSNYTFLFLKKEELTLHCSTMVKVLSIIKFSSHMTYDTAITSSLEKKLL